MRESLNILLGDAARVQDLLEGCFHRGTAASWEEGRRFIAQAIHRAGTILDIGCANGLLLRSLQAWSPYSLVPYGIDNDLSRIRLAVKLFPSQRNNFAHLALENLHSLRARGLPGSFDFVYWNVGNNVSFETPRELVYVQAALRVVRRDGRLILGFYDENAERREAKIKRLTTSGLAISARISNSTLSKEAVWIDRR